MTPTVMPPAPSAPSVDSLLASPQSSLLAPQAPTLPEMRSFGDHRITRQYIYEDALKAANSLEPVSNGRHTLRLSNVQYIDPEKHSRKRQKEAILGGETLGRRMRGTWELLDDVTGDVLDRREQVVARVPFLTHRGTFINGGNEYALSHQQRLLPGVFTRLKNNGDIESHVNVMPGNGASHRYFLDPAKGVFKMKFAQAEMPVLPLMRLMGATDSQLRDAWGPQILAANYKTDDPSVIKKLAARLLKKADQSDDEGTTRERLKAVFEGMKLDPLVTRRTLGGDHKNMSLDAMLATTKKLLAVSRGEAKVDDRDHLAYQTFLGPEDLFSERLTKDHGKVRRMLLKRASMAGNLAKLPSGALTSQLDQAILGSGLGIALEEINPAEILDKQSRVSRLGEGGIPSEESVPDEARSVQPSHMGFMDPLRTPESFRAGIDLNMARGARKGRDGRVYAQFRDPRSGELIWKSPQDIDDKNITFPGLMAGKSKRVLVMRGGEWDYVKKRDVDLVLPAFEDAFSPLGNLVPAKSMVKGQRVAMASRMLTQALPLVGGQAPLVRGAMPGSKGGRSFEEEHGTQMGAVRAGRGGRVMAINDGTIKVRYDDGSTDDIETYQSFPFNRKTAITQTPLVKPGDTFKQGQTLVRSNFTDEQGNMALGLNARVAYIPWEGYNFEDAQVISESMAKRMSSEHHYQHGLDVDDKTKLGKKNFVSLFPQKFDKKTLAMLDDDGVVKPGTQVEYGQPIILAARERDRAVNKLHKKRQAGFTDNAVLWNHHDPGVVTDVVRGKKGPVVLVRSVSAMQVGDKMSGRYGDKGVLAAIVPDDQMPHDKDGRPYEVLLNPLGVVSRTNPAQLLESALGKIAEKTGQPINVSDFEDVKDMAEWAQQQLRKHGLTDTDDVYLPKQGVRVGAVATGNRFFMKLHHTSESKAQGRSGGSYSMDETPAKGGETGCFTGGTRISLLAGGDVPIEQLVMMRWNAQILSAEADGSERWAGVSDWFSYSVPAARLIEIELENGEVISVTSNHVMYLKDGTPKLAGDLTTVDELMEVRRG